MNTPSEINISVAPIPVTKGLLYGKTGQSLYDLCLQSYGTMDLFYQFLKDNNIDSALLQSVTGKAFIFDKTKIKDTAIYARNVIENVFYATMFAPPYGTAGSIELREDYSIELREDRSLELRDQ